MAYFRNKDWIDDEQLEEQMSKYVQQGYQRTEMLDFLRRDFLSVRGVPDFMFRNCSAALA